MSVQPTILSRILLAVVIALTGIIGITKMTTGQFPWESNKTKVSGEVSEADQLPEKAGSGQKIITPIDGYCENNIMPTEACKNAYVLLAQRFPPSIFESIEWKKIPKFYNCSTKSGYEAVFALDNQIIEAEFDLEGYLLEIEHENVPFSRLPPPVKQAFSKEFPNETPNTFELEVMPNGQTFFEIEIHSQSDTDVTYDVGGNRVRPNPCED